MEDAYESTECSNCKRMQQDKEEFAEEYQKLKEERNVLFSQNAEITGTNLELSRLLCDLRIKLDIDHQQRQQELRNHTKEMEDLRRAHDLNLPTIPKEKDVLEWKFKEFERTSPILVPSSQTESAFSFSSTNISSLVDMMQLEELISKCKDQNHEGSQYSQREIFQLIEDQVVRIRVKMQEELESIENDAYFAEDRQDSIIQARDEELKLIKEECQALKGLLGTVTDNNRPKSDTLKAALKEDDIVPLTARGIIQKENEEPSRDHLHMHCDSNNQMTQRSDKYSDFEDVPESGDSSKSSFDSSLKKLGLDKTASKSGTDKTPLTMLKFVLLKNMIACNSVHTKRKENPGDCDEASKKLKSSIEPISQEDEGARDCKTRVNPTIIELEREILQQKTIVRDARSMIGRIDEELKELTSMYQEVLKEKSDLLLITGVFQATHITTSGSVVPRASEQLSSRPSDRSLLPDLNPLPVNPIGREDVRLFFDRPLFYEAWFSNILYSMAVEYDDFLLYFPIGIVNPGATFCYLNSVVQALANIPLFALRAVCDAPANEGSLLHALCQIYKYFWIRKTDLYNANRPSILYADEIRSYYARNHGGNFNPAREHDADEFLIDLVENLEIEASIICDGVEEDNLLTKLFRGYIVAPDGTKEYFRTLRLSIADERIDSIGNALLYHLLIVKPPGLTRTVPQLINTMGVPQTLTENLASTKPPCNLAELQFDSTGYLNSSNIIASPPYNSPCTSDPGSTADSSYSDAIPSSEYPPTRSTSPNEPCSSKFSHENITFEKYSPSEQKSAFSKISSVTVSPANTLDSTLPMHIFLKTNFPTISKSSTNSDSEKSREGFLIEERSCIPSPGTGIAPESSEGPSCGGISIMEISTTANSVRFNSCPRASGAQIQLPSSENKGNENDEDINTVSDQNPWSCTNGVTLRDGKSCPSHISKTIVTEDNHPPHSIETLDDLSAFKHMNLAIKNPEKCRKNNSNHCFWTTNVYHEENSKIPEKTAESCVFNINSLPSGSTDHFEMPIRIDADHEAKPTAHLNSETNSGFEEMGDRGTNLNAIFLQDDVSFDNLIFENCKKIYTPEILCVTLDRRNIDLSFNFKVLPAENLVIPADVRAPAGTTRPAFYKLMSIIQYVPMGPTSGHYYTYVKTGRGDGYMINDHLVSIVANEAFDLTAEGGRSFIFVYARQPHGLKWLPGSK